MCVSTYSSVQLIYGLLGTHGNYSSAYFESQEPETWVASCVAAEGFFEGMFFFEESGDEI